MSCVVGYVLLLELFRESDRPSQLSTLLSDRSHGCVPARKNPKCSEGHPTREKPSAAHHPQMSVHQDSLCRTTVFSWKANVLSSIVDLRRAQTDRSNLSPFPRFWTALRSGVSTLEQSAQDSWHSTFSPKLCSR